MSLEITEVKDELVDKCIKEKSPNLFAVFDIFNFDMLNFSS